MPAFSVLEIRVITNFFEKSRTECILKTSQCATKKNFDMKKSFNGEMVFKGEALEREREARKFQKKIHQ